MRDSLLVLLLLVLIGASNPSQAQIELATDAPGPLTPQKSRELFAVPEGFRVELVASEPHLADPTAIAFGPRGRMFVCELHGYNLEGYLEMVELNKTGVLDKKVRRIDAPKEVIERAAKQQFGTVKMLEDTDGDGCMDRTAVWADHLPPCYGVVAARDGVIVFCAPEIIYLGDTNGDGKPDVRETLFSGFGTSSLWSRVNNPRWGLDNWIYGVGGIGSSGTISGPRLAQPVPISAVCFRFKADGTAFEPVSGHTSGFGQAINDWGDRFLVSNQQHALFVAPLAYRYLVRNPFYAAPNPVLNISSYGHPARVFPTSKPDPWRLARSKDPAWVKFYGEAETTANGFFTAASGQAVYRGDQFPAEYYGNHFSVDNAQNMVHRCLLVPDGNSFLVKRPHKDEKTEFLTSTEQWFRPVNLETGPDGALYIVDMYRDIIEDYSAIPRYLQQLYVNSIIAGSDKGRIWRVVHDSARKTAPDDLTKASDAMLVETLSHANAWKRQTAQNLLIQRGQSAKNNNGPTVKAIADMVADGKTPQARLHALYTLDGLGKLSPEQIEAALADPHFAVRMHTLQVSEKILDAQPTITKKLAAMIDDPHSRVRLQLAFSLGRSRDPQAIKALALLAARHGNDLWMHTGILTSATDSAGELLALLLGEPGEHGRSLLGPLVSIVGARRDSRQIGRLMQTVAELEDAGLQMECLTGLLKGLKQGKPGEFDSAQGRRSLSGLLNSPSEQIRGLALNVAGQLNVQNSPEIRAAFAAAAASALDEKQSIAARTAALKLLAGAPFDQLLPVVETLLDVRQPLEMQLEAVAAFSTTDNPQMVSTLLDGFAGFTPKVQKAVVDAIFARQNRLPKLLDALEQEVIAKNVLNTLQQLQLKENSNADVSRRAKALFDGKDGNDELGKVLARYQKALAVPSTAKQGELVFDDQCAKCHKLAGKGFEVGPDLSVIKSKSNEMLVSDILDPNNQITVGYSNFTVITKDGRIFTGVLSAETATSITLRKDEGVEDTILRKDIDEMEASSLSMMPEGLEKDVSPQNVVDLISYLRNALDSPAPSMDSTVTLFEDDPAFADVLSSGTGKVSISNDDTHSGKAALWVAPPQRWSLTIPGWKYPIVENPGPGEFRYLRFAWKSSNAAGVMLELAADGQWPDAETPLYRYYSGTNTTGWQAVQVSPQMPRQWTVVTRDLWQDFGPFTLTGLAPTTMGGDALFDQIELLRSIDEPKKP